MPEQFPKPGKEEPNDGLSTERSRQINEGMEERREEEQRDEEIARRRHTEIVANERLRAIQEVATRHDDIDVAVLKKAGEIYTIPGYTGPVDEGSSRIEISHPNINDLSNFWEEVEEAEKG